MLPKKGFQSMLISHVLCCLQVDGTGQASAEQADGHQGQRSTRSADGASQQKRKKVFLPCPFFFQ